MMGAKKTNKSSEEKLRGGDPKERAQKRKEKGKRMRAHGGCLWLSEATKDVTSCEKPRGSAHAK